MKPKLTTLLTAMTLALSLLSSHAGEKEYYELSTFRLKSEEKAKLFDETFAPAFLAAMKAAGASPIGVFKPTEVKEEDKGEVLRYILAPYKSIKDWESMGKKIEEHSALLSPALPFLAAEKTDPNYSRVDSMLLVAFDGMPKLIMPKAPTDKAGRHFEIRTYESHSFVRGALKVEMFNKGELDIFKKTNLNAVFFGSAKVASNLPQLTYMLVYDNEELRKKAWKDFLAHPDWLELKKNDRYKDTVSKIISRFVKATDYSQIQ